MCPGVCSQVYSVVALNNLSRSVFFLCIPIEKNTPVVDTYVYTCRIAMIRGVWKRAR